MKKVLIIFLFIISLCLFTGIASRFEGAEKGREAQSEDSQISYSIIDEKVTDAPIKTQVAMSILVSGKIAETPLRNLLNKLYTAILARRGFKFHTAPTNVYIYAFISKEHYDSGLGQWIAMLMKSYDDQVPSIKINQSQIKQIGAKPEEKLGLSGEQRKMIFKELVVYEEKSWKKAEEVYALPDSLDYSKEWGRAQLLKRAIFQEVLNKRYNGDVAKRYNLTLEQLKEISLEGVTKDWPVNIDENVWRVSYEVTEKQITELMVETEREIINREEKEVARQKRPLPQIETQENLVLDLNKGTLGQLKVGDTYENNDSLFKVLGGPPDNVYFSYKNYYYKRGMIIDAGKQTTTGRNIIFEITIFMIPMNFSDDWMVQFRGQITPSLQAKENKTTLISKFGRPDKESGYISIDLIYKRPYGRLTFSCNKNSKELERIILDTVKE